MLINKEKSKKIKKILSLSLALDIMIPLESNAKTIISKSIDEQIQYHRRQYLLEEKINNLSTDLYDSKYNDFCDNDSIMINDIYYQVKFLHIEYGYIGDEKIVYLEDYHNPKFDIITGKEKNYNYKRIKVIPLKYSDVFYEYYCDNGIKNLNEYISQFEGNINYNVPETYFYNPIFDNNENMEKTK